MVKSGKGYIARPTPGAREATVTVSAHTKDGTKSLGPGVKFRVKQIPTPIGMVAGKTGDDIMSKGEIGLIGAVSAKLEGFDFDLPFPVVSFDLTTVNNTGLLLTKSTVGNVLSADIKKTACQCQALTAFCI